MSRIAGISSPSIPADLLREQLGRMLRPLPGPIDAVAAQGPVAMGLRSRGYGGAIATVGPLTCAVDGQVFNADELLGNHGPTINDAELIISLYQRHGMLETLRRLNADLAVALFDRESGTLWLARDRFGCKPMYFAPHAGGLAFASQPRALLALPGMPRDVNRLYAALVAASHYRTFDHAPASSPYRAIAQLPARTALEFRDGVQHQHTYWSLVDRPDLEDNERALAEQYQALLGSAVRRRLKVAPTPGFTLSGGMDSSSVLCTAVGILGTPQTAFSSVYEDRTYDERDDIRDLLDTKVSPWHPVEIGNDLDVFEAIEKLVAIHDEPVATATWLAHSIVCDVASRTHNALFGGLGGDELNAGEYEYFPFFFADLHAHGDARLGDEIGSWARHHDHPIFRKNSAVAAAMMDARTDPSMPWLCRPDTGRLRRYNAALDPSYFDLDGFEPPVDRPFESYLKNRAYHDLFRETTPCCLRAEDRQCTAAGLLHYDPFLDYELVEFMFRVPGTLKIRHGVTKYLLREAMRGVLPEGTRTRVKKTGWNAPAHRWFGGANLERLRDLVRSRDFRDLGLYRVDEVERIIEDHTRIVSTGAVEENHMMFLWQLVNVFAWARGRIA